MQTSLLYRRSAMLSAELCNSNTCPRGGTDRRNGSGLKNVAYSTPPHRNPRRPYTVLYFPLDTRTVARPRIRRCVGPRVRAPRPRTCPTAGTLDLRSVVPSPVSRCVLVRVRVWYRAGPRHCRLTSTLAWPPIGHPAHAAHARAHAFCGLTLSIRRRQPSFLAAPLQHTHVHVARDGA